MVERQVCVSVKKKKKVRVCDGGWSESQAGEIKQTQSVGAAVSGNCTQILKHDEITASAAV